MRSMLAVLPLAFAVCTVGSAETYWIAWEGEGETASLPEQCGWSRHWGNWDGQYQGLGAYRTLENGILTYDSLYDPGVFDFSIMHRPGETDPAPGEAFVMWWSLSIEQTFGGEDPGVGAASDSARIVGFTYTAAHLRSDFEGVIIPISPGFHDYWMVSWDMVTYELYIDGGLAHVGTFWQGVSASYVAWGDAWQGAASLHRWRFFRFGVLEAAQAGDTNCDGAVDLQDINPFVKALSNPIGYQQEFPTCWLENADINEDGSVDFADINPFIALLTGYEP